MKNGTKLARLLAREFDTPSQTDTSGTKSNESLSPIKFRRGSMEIITTTEKQQRLLSQRDEVSHAQICLDIPSIR